MYICVSIKAFYKDKAHTIDIIEHNKSLLTKNKKVLDVLHPDSQSRGHKTVRIPITLAKDGIFDTILL